MRKYFLSLLAGCAMTLSAQAVLDVSTLDHSPFYTVLQPDGVPHMYVFADLNKAVLQTQDGGVADWYSLPDNTIQAQGYTAFTRAEDGGTYRVVQNGVADTFTVFDYQRYRLVAEDSIKHVHCAPSCEGTMLSTGDVPAMHYYTAEGISKYMERPVYASYEVAQWDSTTWRTLTREKALIVTDWNEIALGEPLYQNTTITLCDTVIAPVLYGANDCVEVEPFDAVAVAFRPTLVTTTRGTQRENELDRPIDESQLKGSAPMNILFKANPSPLVNYTEWKISYSTDILSVRTEQETRYEFLDAGSYTVSLTVGNDQCTKDTSYTVTVSESMLAVPNVFTPNGDGVNDEFRVAYRSLREFHIWVYDRWGHQVYTSTDPAKGWDGTIANRPASEGAYFYVIRAMGTDAADDARYRSNAAIKKKMKEDPDALMGIYQLSGAVNLLRGKK